MTLERWFVFGWLALASSALLGCLPATQTLLDLDAEPSLRGAATSVHVRVITSDERVMLDEERAVDQSWQWPSRVPISPLDGDASRRFRVEATLKAGADTVTARVALGFAKGRQNIVGLLFEAACRNVSCPEGFTCSGGECVSMFQDAEGCGLPDNRGCDPETHCGCPSGYRCGVRAQGATCLRENPVAGCRNAEDCPDAVCDYETGACRARSPSVCAFPEESGVRSPGRPCSTEDPCLSGSVCVPNRAYLDSDSGTYGLSAEGLCREACNPCEGCGEQSCIALPTGGGFCSPGLGGEGDACAIFAASGLCGAGLLCAGVCRRSCSPLGIGEISVFTIRSAWTSADCRDGEVCTVQRLSVDGNAYHCTAGRLTGVGESCDERAFCPYPLVCLEPGICGLSMEECGVCPPPTHCRQLTSRNLNRCVREHARTLGEVCQVDLDCKEGLSCRLVESELLCVLNE